MAIKERRLTLKAAIAIQRYRRAEQGLLAIDHERTELDHRFSRLVLTFAASGRGQPNTDHFSEIEAELLAVHNRLTELLDPWQYANRNMSTAYERARALLREAGFYGAYDA